MPTLMDLPPELLGQVISHVDKAKTVCSLEQTCRHVHEIIQEDGYRIFVQKNFPSLKTPPYWRDAAHALSTLTQCWERRALLARFVVPNDDIVRLPHGRVESPPPVQRYRRMPGAQSMGYQPVIDCVQEWSGSWGRQTETLAIGTGAELKIRIRSIGVERKGGHGASTTDTSSGARDHLGRREKWLTWKPSSYWDGKDDITSLNILGTSTSTNSTHQDLIIGRASGVLERLHISEEGTMGFNFETNGRFVRSAHISPSSNPLIAASLSDGSLALWNSESASDADSAADPLAEISVQEPQSGINTWTNRFMTSSKVAVGRGPSKYPIIIHNVAPDGISREPLHKITSKGSGHLDIITDESPAKTTSVYSIAPLSASSAAGSAEGGQFLSGWYGGEVKLHDLRSGGNAVTSFLDPIDPTSAIYSLLPFGHERFVAGGARHSLIKVFDLRMPGTKRYSTVDTSPEKDRLVNGSSHTTKTIDTPKPRDFNVFLANGLSPGGLDPRVNIKPNSPVYALAAGSAFSPIFYAGLEDGIVEVNLVSGTDRHPDTLFAPRNPLIRPPRQKEIREWLDPIDDVLSLGLVEHIKEGESLDLKVQFPVGSERCLDERAGLGPAWDHRWVSKKDADADTVQLPRRDTPRWRGNRRR